MNHSLTERTLTISLQGRIDSNNADSTEQELQNCCDSCTFNILVLDLQDLNYISSAGLRVLLRLRKDYPSLKLINASNEVYDILEMTGFTEMIPVSKAYRHLSVDGCEVIGHGANGQVYRLDAETVIKVYKHPDCLPDITHERELARKAFVLGIPTAIPYDVVQVGETYGSVFELLSSKSLGQMLAQDVSKVDECAQLIVSLLKKIHSTELKNGDMPDARAKALKWVNFLKNYLPTDLFDKLYSLVSAVPEDHHVIHGDLHLRNVMIQNGEALLIDMDTLSLGHPVFEFSSIFLAYEGFGDLDHSRITNFFHVPYEVCQELMNKIFMQYFEIADDSTLENIKDKARIVGYTRLMRRTIRRDPDSAEGKETITHCKVRLVELLARVDQLTF